MELSLLSYSSLGLVIPFSASNLAINITPEAIAAKISNNSA